MVVSSKPAGPGGVVLSPIPTSQAELVATIVGVAIFDLSGLPQEYFVTAEESSTGWVQLVFQALGLKSLLMSSLKLDGFQHLVIAVEHRTAIVVRTRSAYVALLFDQRYSFDSVRMIDSVSQWVRQFEQNQLRTNDRFKAA